MKKFLEIVLNCYLMLDLLFYPFGLLVFFKNFSTVVLKGGH